jgi:hypothetical protein
MRLLYILFLGGMLSFSNGPVWNLAASGKNSGVMESKTVVYHSKKALLKAWEKMRKSDPSLGKAPPDVDFKKQMIIACYDGSQSNGLRADSVWISEATLHLRLVRLSIKAGCHNATLLVTPWVWIRIDRKGWNVLKEEEKVEIRECN